MTRILEISFIPQVEDIIRELGYKFTREPSKVPNRRLWQDDPASLVRGLRFRPDILVERGKKIAIVEVKTRPVLLGGVIQARQYADYFGAAVILCVPDDVFPEIPRSVKEFAEEQGIRLCPLADVGNALKDLLD
jgi:hypothetical protein